MSHHLFQGNPSLNCSPFVRFPGSQFWKCLHLRRHLVTMIILRMTKSRVQEKMNGEERNDDNKHQMCWPRNGWKYEIFVIMMLWKGIQYHCFFKAHQNHQNLRSYNDHTWEHASPEVGDHPNSHVIIFIIIIIIITIIIIIIIIILQWSHLETCEPWCGWLSLCGLVLWTILSGSSAVWKIS